MPDFHTELPFQPAATLVDLDLHAVALCEQGANSRAHIILNKRKEKTSMPQTFDELMGALEDDNAGVIKAHIEGIEKANKEALEGLQAKVEDLEKSKAADEGPPAEDILKDVPDEVKKQISDLQAQVAGFAQKQAENLAKVRFAKCKAIPADEKTLMDVLKTASPAVVEILEKAAAAIEKGLHTETGVESQKMFKHGTTDAYSKLEEVANELMKADTELTFEQAFTKAIEREPKLYQEYTEGVYGNG